ncbi:DnaB-like helicase C-terminal domain-containing protein [Sediminibacterium sp. C3]|uniref:DnaB-like helicase C-terminal domain-containing protein n=1 Tax=Sediminibacterium sp. C3 TaxID=1267211 RepID=UPI00041CD142|nr:DnaB-like helicase C-terminal domain-containing protein [Sediminibacterium sp. C3]
MQTLKNIFDAELDRLINIQQFQEPAMGASSGYKYLDRALNGFKPQHLYLLSAAPESGKTAFLLNLLLRMTVKKKNPVKALLYSLDVSAAEVAQRLLSCHSCIRLEDIFYGSTRTDLIEQLYIDVDQIKDLSANLLIDDYPSRSLASMREQLADLKAKNEMPAIVVIDNINRIAVADPGEDDAISSSLLPGLKQLAIDFNVPVLCSPQTSAVDPDIEMDSMPRLSSLRKKNFNLDHVDVVMFLVSPNFYRYPGEEEQTTMFSRLGHPMPEGFSEMHVRIPLNRCGPITTVYFTANLECQLVYEDGV